MTNARDAMPTGGTLSVQTRQFNDGVEVLIQDNGCGIPPEHLSRIHEPFFTTKHSGSGLGLSICRVDRLGYAGDLKINSREGEGTPGQSAVARPRKETLELKHENGAHSRGRRRLGRAPLRGTGAGA